MKYLVTQLEKELQDISIVKEIRGKGLMVGIECSEEVAPFIKKLLNKGVLVLSAGTHVLRLLPPLIVTYEEIDKVVKMIKQDRKSTRLNSSHVAISYAVF